MGSEPARIGKVQMRIMDVLWQRGKATARQITEALSKTSQIAHSTVQTLLRQLEKKGAVAHDVEDRIFIYYPLVTKEEVADAAARDLLARLFDGSAYGLVAHLVESEKISRQELERIRKLVDEKEAER